MTAFIVTTEFEMQDGRILQCEYEVFKQDGFNSGRFAECFEGDEVESEPVYLIDGVEVVDLPKGLDAIAELLYCARPGSFCYTKTQLF